MSFHARQNVYSKTGWEKTASYCRAKRVQNTVYVSGTAAVDDNRNVVAPNDMHGQALFVMSKIERALNECGATMKDVVRTRLYVTDMAQCDKLAAVLGNAFRDIDPASTCVEVSSLVSPELLVEIEVDAVIEE